MAYNPTPSHPVTISQLGRWRLRAASHLPNAPASPPVLCAALSLGISSPKLTSILRALGPPRTVRASARSRETLGTESSWRQRLGRHPRTHLGLPHPLAYRELLKLLRTPASSPGVYCGKQVLFTLQMRPWSQDTVPAEGSGLLGKWPAGTPGTGALRESSA